MTGHRQRGIATLGVALGMLLVITLGAISTAHMVLRDQRATANDYRAAKAAAAAEAGLEWGMAQLGVADFKTAAIADTAPKDGWVDANTYQAPAGLLSADVGFQVAYSNPVAGDLTLLNITSVGCADGCSPCAAACPVHRTVQMQAKFGVGLFPKALRSGITAKNQVTLTLTAKSTNLFSNQPGSDLTVWAGGSASYSNGASTISASGSYNNAATDPAAKLNDGALASASTDQFFQNFFSDTQENIKKAIPNLACGATCNASLNGISGQALWITTNLVLTADNVIGTPANPVILITTGDCSISESNVIYGVLYCRNLVGIGTGTKTSSVTGGIIAQNNYSASKVPDVYYDVSVMGRLVALFGNGNSGRVPGSWRDFP